MTLKTIKRWIKFALSAKTRNRSAGAKKGWAKRKAEEAREKDFFDAALAITAEAVGAQCETLNKPNVSAQAPEAATPRQDTLTRSPPALAVADKDAP
jgi:hypothetical protein